MDLWEHRHINETNDELLAQSIARVPRKVSPRQVAFLHIMKTAGTSVHKYLRDIMPGVPVYHGHEILFDAVTPNNLASYGLILGHFSYDHLAKMRDPFVITFLRDPVERVLSFYSHLHGIPRQPGDSPEVQAMSGLPFGEFIRSDNPIICQYLDNQQSYALASDWRAPRDLSDAELFESATRGLRRMDFVGTAEKFEGSLCLLAKSLGVKRPAQFPRENTRPKRIQQKDLTTQELAILKSRNAVDAKLYEHAVSRKPTVSLWHRWFSFATRSRLA